MTFGAPSQPSPAQPAHYAPQPAGSATPNLGLGIVVGFGAAVLGAIVWGGFTGITHYRIGYLSIAIGFFIGWAMVKAAGGHAKELGIAAAIVTLIACAAGDVGTIYIKAMHEFHLSLGNAMKENDPFSLLKDDLSDDKLAILFFLLAAYFAFRYAATGGTGRRPARVPAPQTGYTPVVPAQPTPGTPASQPFGDPAPQSFGGPAPQSFGAPAPAQPAPASANDGYFTQPPAPGGPTG